MSTAGILYGSVTVGGSILSKMGLSTFDISFFFLTFSLLPLLPFALKHKFVQNVRNSWKYLSIYGLVNTCLILLQFESLNLGLPPAVSALLLYTQPIWTIIFSHVFFSERMDKTRVGVVILALAGVLMIIDPTVTFHEIRSGSFYGDISALAGGIFLSLWVILGKRGRLKSFKSAGEMTFAVRGSTLVFVSVISFASLALGANIFVESSELIGNNLTSLLAFAIVAGAIPDYLFYRGITKLQMLQAGIILLLEPVSSAVMSFVLMISPLTFPQLVGGALVLSSNYLVARLDK